MDCKRSKEVLIQIKTSSAIPFVHASVHRVAALIQRWVLGTHRGLLFYRLLQQAMQTSPYTYTYSDITKASPKLPDKVQSTGYKSSTLPNALTQALPPTRRALGLLALPKHVTQSVWHGDAMGPTHAIVIPSGHDALDAELRPLSSPSTSASKSINLPSPVNV
ncbi:MAG: hypothetical protein Q7U28_06365 [Aquabacterium sp.]|nr:hypothetical protein [Aquabacterium sp.]